MIGTCVSFIGLIRRVLADKPEKRYTIPELRNNQWFKKDFSRGNSVKTFHLCIKITQGKYINCHVCL